jgi:chromosome segregation ATPase
VHLVLERCCHLSSQAFKKFDEERGVLETSSDELRAAEHEVAELNAQLDDQRERVESAEAHVAELEGKLGTLDATGEEFVRAKQEWSAREKWLLDNANDVEERMQQLQINRDKVNSPGLARAKPTC